MKLSSIRNFNRSEKLAILKLMIKIAVSDNSIRNQEQEAMQEFLDNSHLRISQEFIRKVLEDSNFRLGFCI